MNQVTRWDPFENLFKDFRGLVLQPVDGIHASTLSTVPLTKSRAWRVRMEVKDAASQTTQTIRDLWTNAYDTPPTVSLGASPTSGTTATTFDLTATGRTPTRERRGTGSSTTAGTSTGTATSRPSSARPARGARRSPSRAPTRPPWRSATVTTGRPGPR